MLPKAMNRYSRNSNRSVSKRQQRATNTPAGTSPKKNAAVFQLLDWGSRQLAMLGKREARASAERLLEEAAGYERAWLYANARCPVSSKAEKKFRGWINLRKKRQPLAYILQKSYFWNEVLKVGPDCLIPRPETEILVEKFIQESGFKKDDRFTFLDLGSGSGAIGIAVLREFPKAAAVFSDLSKKALKITAANIACYQLQDRAQTLCSDLFQAFSESGQKFNAILSNPPYVSGRDWGRLEKEVRREPRMALWGGQDGLDFYRKIVETAPAYLGPGGLLMFEMGQGQSRQIKKLAERYFKIVNIFKDYRGIDRVLFARTNG